MSFNSKPQNYSQLPPNFAQMVLDLESDLNSNCNLSAVQELIHLYTLAVEYYEAIEDAKHFHYQDRLHSLLARPDVLSAFHCTTPLKPASRSLNSSANQDLSAERSADKELLKYHSQYSSTLKHVHESLNKQCTSLAKRLILRRKHREPNNATPYAAYEQQVEAVMEWFAEEKLKAKLQIEDKYQVELEELNALEGYGLLDQVIDRVRQRMDDDIAKALVALERQKKKRIQVIRVKALS